MKALRVVPGIVNGTLPVHRTNGGYHGKPRKGFFLPTVAFAFLVLISSIVPGASAAPVPGGTLDPLAIPQYVTPLVIPPVMKNDGAPDSYDIAVRQFRQQILPGGIWNTLNGRSDTLPPTTVWSYGPAADPTPAVAPDPGSQFNYPGPVPIVTHVHGAHVEGHSDGFPEAWYLPDAINIPASHARKGRLFDDATGANPGNLGYADFRYRNDQPAATLWYHNHALGVTRANVYAGPAGFWLIRGGVFDGASGGDPAGTRSGGGSNRR